MSNKMGIENLKALLTVIVSFIVVGDKMGHESNWNARLSHLFGLIPQLTGLSGIVWSQIDDEIKDLDLAEKEVLLTTFKEKFDIIDDKLEAMIEEALSLATEIGVFVKKVIAFVDKTKDFFKK
jgi:hypothetical protein